MKNIYKYIIVALILGIGGTLFYMKVYIPKTTYKAISPIQGSLNVAVFGIGNVDAKNIYNISSGVSAKIVALHSDIGEWVKKGSLLVELDPVDLPLLIEEAEVGVTKALSEVQASKKELQSLRAQKSLALVTYNRYHKLKLQSFVSQSEYDKAKADLEVVQAQMDATKAHINSAKNEVSRAKKGVLALKERLFRFKIYAPVDGYVIQKDAEVAQTLLAIQSIFKIVRKEDVWVKAFVDEKISGDVVVGQKVSITLRSQSSQTYTGYVKCIAPQSDAITQEREVNIAFDSVPLPFYLNEQAEVEIEVKYLKNILKIPSYAIVYNEKESGVWSKKEGKAHFSKVDILAISKQEIAVKGLSMESQILIPTDKNKALKEGMKVH